jgi:hypothetical protein
MEAPVDGLGRLLAAGAQALHVEGDLHAGRECFEAAFGGAEKAGDAEGMAEAALGLAGLWLHEHREFSAVALLQDRLRRSLAVVDPDGVPALRLRIRIAGEHDYRRGAHAEVLAVLAEARGRGDAVALAEALNVAHQCLMGPEHAVLRERLAAELVAESFRTGRRGDLLLGLYWQMLNQYLRGDPHAERRLTELREQLAPAPHLAMGYAVEAVDVMRAIRSGRLEHAAELAAQCELSGAKAGDVDATVWYTAHRVVISWYEGRLPELLPVLHELVRSPAVSEVNDAGTAVLALAEAAAGNRHAAAGNLARLCRQSLTGLPRSDTWALTLYAMVETACLVGDAQAAELCYGLLAPFAELPVIGGPGVVCLGSVHHPLGVACLTTGNADRAVAHLRDAVRHNLSLAHWPAVAASRRRLAEALTARGAPGDAAAAATELATAREIQHTLVQDTAAADRPAASPHAGQARCTREGRCWRITLGSRSALVAHSVGVLHLAMLLANPRQDIQALDLVSGLGMLTRPRAATSQALLDDTAVREYRSRLRDLQARLDTAEDLDPDQAAALHTEREWLLAELAGAAGINGSRRKFTDDRERARIAVGKAIRRAVQRIGEADPVIADHLRRTVHTGTRCAYWPV